MCGCPTEPPGIFLFRTDLGVTFFALTRTGLLQKLEFRVHCPCASKYLTEVVGIDPSRSYVDFVVLHLFRNCLSSLKKTATNSANDHESRIAWLASGEIILRENS